MSVFLGCFLFEGALLDALAMGTHLQCTAAPCISARVRVRELISLKCFLTRAGRRPGLHFPAGHPQNYRCLREVTRRQRRRSRLISGGRAGASRFEWLRARARSSPEDWPTKGAPCHLEATSRRRPRRPLRRRQVPRNRRRRRTMTTGRRRTPRSRRGRRLRRPSSGSTSCAAASTWTRRRGRRPGTATGA